MAGSKCKVCGRYIRGVYINYGGLSCSSCATFFGRAIHRRNEYTCGNNYMCLTTATQDGANCKTCRFEKCLQIGMRMEKFMQTESEATDEYSWLAKQLYALLTVITEDPMLLLNYYLEDDMTILLQFNAAMETLPQFPAIQGWAKILRNNQIPSEESHLLFYSITAFLKFPWLSIDAQQKITFSQQLAIKQFLIPSSYSSPEIKEAFDKLTLFFKKHYHKHFVIQKLREHGLLSSFDPAFIDHRTKI